MALGTTALGPALALPARTQRGPCVSHSSVAQRCCPWGVRSPRGEFLRERRRLKIVALGSRPIFVLLQPLPASSLWGVGQRVPFLGCSSLLRPDPATPFSPYGTMDPGSEKGPRAGGLSSSGHPGQKVEASGLFSS